MNSHQVRVNQFILRGSFLPRYVCTESKIFILLRRLVVIVCLVVLLAFLLSGVCLHILRLQARDCPLVLRSLRAFPLMFEQLRV